MAIIKCPECGKEISDRAASCPSCGLPSRHFKIKTFKTHNAINAIPNRWEPVSTLDEAIRKFPKLCAKSKLDNNYRNAIERVFSLFQENSFKIYSYTSGFLGVMPSDAALSLRIYAALDNIQDVAVCILRVKKDDNGYYAFPCNNINNINESMPKAMDALRLSPNKNEKTEFEKNYVKSNKIQPTKISDEKVIDTDTDSQSHSLPNRYLSETDIISLSDRLGGKEKAKFIVDDHNEHWINQQLISRKSYLDSILFRVDPNISLDEEQRKAILTDEDHALIVAGAGAGKTTTMAAKVKYLVDQHHIRPERILVISYTNKAVDELKDRINKKLGIPAIISTFHKFGFELIKKAAPDTPEIHYNPSSLISDYMETMILKNPRMLKRILYFFSYYFDVSEDAMKFETLEQYHYYKASQDLLTLKSHLNEYNRQVMDNRTKAMRTCQGEYLRSYQEVQIANFLYLNNLEYEYEPHYEKPIPELSKPYTPDFIIRQGELQVYLEHFGIHQNGSSTLYTPHQLSRYISRIEDKRRIHHQYGTVLLETYSSYNDGRSLLEHLKETLEQHGLVLKEQSAEVVYKKIVDTSKDKYFYRFVDFAALFISRFKTNGFELSEFNVLRKKTDNVRTLLFLDLIEEIYLSYQQELKNRNRIDFDDMINEAEKILELLKNQGRKLPFDYIVIDEYQDISLQRFNLAKRLTEVTDAKIIAVGDDWQSIFAFAGSDITLFTRFLELMGSGKELKITHTYRNSQELIDIAGSFIQKNSAQINKKLISPRKLPSPIEIILYDDTQKVLDNKAKSLVSAIGKLIKEFGIQTKILLIGRYNFDMYQFVKTQYFEQISEINLRCKEYPAAQITFLTAHSAKGLGFDNVILLNAIDHRFGFPCQIEDDPIMKHVIHQDRTIPFAEERRLFYVAMTRTKNRLLVLVPETRPSRFIIELINDHGVICDELSSINIDDSWKLGLRCPQCGFPLRYEPFKKSIGLPLYICTNEPEICDFMTNSKERLADIRRCNKCDDGYLIVKKRRKENHFFYGCTNYKDGAGGCKNGMEIPVLGKDF